MLLAIFGASGQLGLRILEQNLLLEQHSVSVLVRNEQVFRKDFKDLLQEEYDGRLVQGDSLNPTDVDETIKGADAVIVSLGSKTLKATTVVSDSQKLINQACVKYKVRKLVVVTSLGVGSSKYDVKGFTWFFTSFILGHILPDKEVQEESLKSLQSVKYTIVRPGGLNNKGRSEYEFMETGIAGGMASRQNVAHFILTECLKGHDGQALTITNK